MRWFGTSDSKTFYSDDKSGIFSVAVKMSRSFLIVPMNDWRELADYRPIYLLASSSILFESMIYKQRYSYLDTHKLLSYKQYFFHII